MIEAFVDKFRFLEADVIIVYTFLIHGKNKVIQQNNI